MNGFELFNPPPVQINIGSFSLFADYIKITGSSVISEQANISGGISVTNRSVKNTSVTLSGRLAGDSDFLGFIIYAENILKNKTSVSFEYKEILFNPCVLKSYSAENKDLGITEIKLIFSVSGLSEVDINAG